MSQPAQLAQAYFKQLHQEKNGAVTVADLLTVFSFFDTNVLAKNQDVDIVSQFFVEYIRNYDFDLSEKGKKVVGLWNQSIF